MRITQRSMQFGIAANLQGALGRMQALQQQLSSGRQISKPSDSPTGSVAALRFRADIRRSEQLKRNADDAAGWLSTADRALTGQLEIVNRARGILLEGVNGAAGPEARNALAAEMEQLREAALAVGNTTYLGRPVFAGTSTEQQAYAADGTYLGNDGAIDRVVSPDVSVRANVSGTEAFGPPGADLFAVLADIADHLRNDPSQLSADIAGLDSAFTRLLDTVAGVGARANQVDGMRDRVESRILDATAGLAEVESIDLPETIMKLQIQDVAYQAALGATARMIQPSLVDFLR